MSVNITDSSTFTSPIVAPADGDAATAASVVVGMQGLANRTKYLSDNLLLAQSRQFGRFALSGASLVGGGSISIAETSDPISGYSVASGEITLPSVGWYLALASMRLSCDGASNPQSIAASIVFAGSALAVLQWNRYSATTAEFASVCGSAIFECTNISSQKLSAISNTSGLNVIHSFPEYSHLSVIRLL